MTQPYQPNQQQPAQPFGGPVPGPGFAQQPERRGNPGLAVLVGIVAMLVGAAIYGGIMRATAKDGGEYTLYAYPAAAAGILAGVALGKIGGRNPALPFVGIVLGVLGAIIGQFFGYALMVSHWSGGEISAVTAITDHFDILKEGFKEDFDALVAVIYAVGGGAGFALTRRLAG